MLKRPTSKRLSSISQSTGAGVSGGNGTGPTGSVTFDLLLAAVIIACVGFALAFRQRVYDDVRALLEIAAPCLLPYCDQCIEAARPQVEAANELLDTWYAKVAAGVAKMQR
uniref:Uncharacterized protein n=1 Tax=Haptolina brevifila TaxID=156173 RepID=A0A7S2CH38_9EUKA|mmetsp:Transcript_24863/g.49914  ORF Transcript_24863/g.49914 Transcript_24863/m.49914 type:complete len:111 (+) Transcript_24863:79-411(+)